MDAAERKKLESRLREMIELNDESQVTEKQTHSKSNPAIVIRRRKGKQDQNITRQSNK
jgi:phage terminase large subunit-like protein